MSAARRQTVSIGPPSFVRRQLASGPATSLKSATSGSAATNYVFVVIHLETRQLLHAASTLAPTAAWTVQQLRDLTPFGIGPKFLLRDNDGKFTAAFDAIAVGTGIRVIRTPVLAPKANAFVERCVGSLRREYLDHVLLLSQGHLQRVLDEYRPYFNASRPHQGIGQRRPAAFGSPAGATNLRPDTTVDASLLCSEDSITTTASPPETLPLARMGEVANTTRRGSRRAGPSEPSSVCGRSKDQSGDGDK